MKIKLILGVVLMMFVVMNLSCNDNSSINWKTPFSGIMRTDEVGNTLGGDLTDWCYGIVFDAAKIPEPPVPTEFAFYPAYPNPCNGSTTLRFDIPVQCPVSLVIKSSQGQEVKHLFSGTQEQAGTYTIFWPLTDDDFEKLPDGIYRAYLTAADFECYGDIQIFHPK